MTMDDLRFLRDPIAAVAVAALVLLIERRITTHVSAET
jgi:hypothetical protein